MIVNCIRRAQESASRSERSFTPFRMTDLMTLTEPRYPRLTRDRRARPMLHSALIRREHGPISTASTNEANFTMYFAIEKKFDEVIGGDWELRCVAIYSDPRQTSSLWLMDRCERIHKRRDDWYEFRSALVGNEVSNVGIFHGLCVRESCLPAR